MNRPAILPGGVHVDTRGMVRHVNGFKLGTADRFYVITPTRTGEWRGWVGHRRDWKWFFNITGEMVICIAAVDELEGGGTPAVVRVNLSEQESQLLEVPPGFATAIQARSLPASLLVLSTGRIEGASDDMLRFPIGDPSCWIINPLVPP
jgi:dTDP-4-dehydrorhamnose 3,5-epimerase-like enzyme